MIKELQSVFESTIHLLKIKTPSEKKSDETILAEINDFATINFLNNYKPHIYADKSVESGIGRFCAESSFDLVAIGTHQSKGLSKLFRGSISNDIVNHLFHPILTFPI